MSFEWELSKENVRPLKQGRNMDTLNAALGQQKPALQRSLEAQRVEYEKQLGEEASESDDPVTLYQNYVSWVEQSYASGNRKPLMEALEKSIRALMDMKNDIRCLKLWLKYIDLTGDSSKQLPLFDHLNTSQYFQDHALLYEAWAALLENLNRHKEAEVIYKRGIERKAVPLARLQRHHREFEQRVMAGIVTESKRPTTDTTRAAQPARKALSNLGDRAGVVRSGTAIQGSAGVVNTRKAAPLTNARPVVLDETNARPVVLDENSQSNCKKSRAALQHVGTAFSHANQENVKSAGKWGGNKVEAHHAIQFSDLKQASSSVKVFGDPEAAIVQLNVGPETKSVVPASVLRPHKATAADTAGGLASISKPCGGEQPMYPKALVYTEHGEFSLEEIRARRELQIYAEEQAQTADPDAMDLTRVISKPIQFAIDRDTITKLTARRELTITRRLSFDGLTPELTLAQAGHAMRHFDWNSQSSTITREVPRTAAPAPVGSSSSSSLSSSSLRSSSTITPSPAQNALRDVCSMATPLPTGIVGERLPLISSSAVAGFPAIGGSSGQPPVTAYSVQDSQRLPSAEASSSMTCLGPVITPTMTYHTRYATDRMMSAMKSNDIDGASLEMKPASSVATASTSVASISTSSVSTAVASQPLAAQPECVTIFDESARSESVQIYDESAAPADKENSGRVRKPRQNSGSGLRGLTAREAPKALAAAEEEDMPEEAAVKPSTTSTPGPAAASCSTIPPPGLSTIRQPHWNGTGDYGGDTPTATWANPKRGLTPIEEEMSRTGSSLSRTGSTGSSRSGMCSSTLSATNRNTIAEEEPMDDVAPAVAGVVVDDAAPVASTCFTADDTVVNGMYVGDPFSTDKHFQWIQRIGTSLAVCPGYKDLSQKPLPELSSNLLGKAVILDEDDSSSVFVLKEELGVGAYSTVYSANHIVEFYNKDNEDIVALKVSESDEPDMWEFFLSCHLPQRIADAGYADAVGYFVNVKQCFHYANGTCMVLDKFKCTLLDVVNLYKKQRQPIPEALVLYYAWHMLYAAEALHAAGYLHADIKPDNFVISNDLLLFAGHLKDKTTEFVSSNLAELNVTIKPIHLIDYGRAIDMSCLPSGTAFTTACETEDFACVEMKEDRPWTQQIDTYGILGTIHVMLNGDYMQTEKKPGSNSWQATLRPKRYWNPIWTKIYSQFINVPSCHEQPDLATLREGVGKALEANAAKLHSALVYHHQVLTSF